MLHGLLFGIGFFAAGWLIWRLVGVVGIRRAVGSLFKIMFWITTPIATVVMFWWPPAAVWLMFAFLIWVFFLNPRERSDPRWADVLGFTLCAGMVAFVTIVFLAGLDRPAPSRAVSAKAPANWLEEPDLDQPAPRKTTR